ncbi:vWA domain-containing protein [Rhodospirillum sp. A1_3_36]|uniref:vWA domain-containing protein n=1 Tax=Rhodospirillum sp. A1_3_36 TaxID=3391666 RepID=UPI0039A5ED34
MITVEQPLAFLLLPLLLLPVWARLERTVSHPWLGAVPGDSLSKGMGILLRGAAFLALAALVLGLAGPHGPESRTLRQGKGASLVFLFDRSSSMDNTFANRHPDGSEESKAAVAKRLVLDFLERRPRDRIGVAAFSTTPMMVMPITGHLEAVRSAVAATDEPGLARTDVGRGLILGFDMFSGQGGGESRALILVSDGAGVVGREVQETLRKAVKRDPVPLYWLYIRSKGSHGLEEKPEEGAEDTPRARPERHLHLLLQSLGVPYRAWEADSPEAVKDAIAEIDRIESRPIHYVDITPRRPLAPVCYAVAALCLALLGAAVLLERSLLDPKGPLPPIRHREAGR